MMLQELLVLHKSGIVLFSWRAAENELPFSPVNAVIDSFLLEGQSSSVFNTSSRSKSSSFAHLKFDKKYSLAFCATFVSGTSIAQASEVADSIYAEFVFTISNHAATLVRQQSYDAVAFMAKWFTSWEKMLLNASQNSKSRVTCLTPKNYAFCDSTTFHTGPETMFTNSSTSEGPTLFPAFKTRDSRSAEFSVLKALDFSPKPSPEDSVATKNYSSRASNGNWLSQLFEGNTVRMVAGDKALRDDDLALVLEHLKSEMLKKNVASSSAEQICKAAHSELLGMHLFASSSKQVVIRTAVKNALRKSLSHSKEINLISQISLARSSKRPYTIVFIGVNGVGKSTSLSKVANWLLMNKISVMVSACDTFRAGAVEQLRTHCQHLGVPLYERGYQKDPSIIAQGTIAQAKRQGVDVVLIDTAGRMQDNEPLMRALAKLIELNSPDLILFVGEALVGNDAVDQLEKFNASLSSFDKHGRKQLIDAILVSKFDTVDDKVGAAISMVQASGAPIIFVGCGQTYQDLRIPNVENLIDSLIS